ncbi:MAG: hypothetical protein Q8K85_21455 [Hyphomicrobium sp.]|nr:hypothetical protein [Hyphomicrobium sp.]
MASDNLYRALVAGLQHMGRVSVISTKTPHPVVVDEDLRRQADHFIDLSDLKPCFEAPKEIGARPPMTLLIRAQS